VHRSQNRIESYHQLRAFIAEVSGKKHLTGRTDLDVAISNECGRLIANRGNCLQFHPAVHAAEPVPRQRESSAGTSCDGGVHGIPKRHRPARIWPSL
jgi:hypothetical protein